MHPEIKQFIKYQEIRQFSVLVNMCRIYDQDSCARYAHYKSISEKKSGSQNRGKPYEAPADKGKWKASGGKETSGGGNCVPLKCFKCGEISHHASECKGEYIICFKCNKPEHCAAECKIGVVTCFNYGELGHISTQCQKT